MKQNREEKALEALVGLALHHSCDKITDAEIQKYLSKPVKLSKEDEDALKRARPALLKSLRSFYKQ